MLKSLRTTFALSVLAAVAALTASALAEEKPAAQDSPWAMRAPAAAPQGAPTRSAAQVAEEKGTPEQQELARQMVDAIYVRDTVKMKRLVAPSILKCIGNDKQPYLEDKIKKQFGTPINKNYHLTVSKLPPNVFRPSKYSTYPLQPTHVLEMEFPTADGGSATINQVIGQENGRWYETMPCPTELGMQRFAKMQQAEQAGRIRAKEAMTRVKEPLKSQLLTLIAQRDNADAWKLCMRSLHVDFQTARSVVALLSGDED
jgi:hypothetical protein